MKDQSSVSHVGKSGAKPATTKPAGDGDGQLSNEGDSQQHTPVVTHSQTDASHVKTRTLLADPKAVAEHLAADKKWTGEITSEVSSRVWKKTWKVFGCIVGTLTFVVAVYAVVDRQSLDGRIVNTMQATARTEGWPNKEQFARIIATPESLDSLSKLTYEKLTTLQGSIDTLNLALDKQSKAAARIQRERERRLDAIEQSIAEIKGLLEAQRRVAEIHENRNEPIVDGEQRTFVVQTLDMLAANMDVALDQLAVDQLEETLLAYSERGEFDVLDEIEPSVRVISESHERIALVMLRHYGWLYVSDPITSDRYADRFAIYARMQRWRAEFDDIAWAYRLVHGFSDGNLGSEVPMVESDLGEYLASLRSLQAASDSENAADRALKFLEPFCPELQNVAEGSDESIAAIKNVDRFAMEFGEYIGGLRAVAGLGPAESPGEGD